MNKNVTKKRRHIKPKVIKTILLISVLIVVALGVWYLANHYIQKQGIDENATEYVSTMTRPDSWQETRIAYPGYGTLFTSADTNTLNVSLSNSQGNPCYFQYTIYLDEENKEVYKSKLIEPGMAVTTVKLNQKIKAGKYPITIKIDTFDLKDKDSPMEGTEIKTNILAE